MKEFSELNFIEVLCGFVFSLVLAEFAILAVKSLVFNSLQLDKNSTLHTWTLLSALAFMFILIVQLFTTEAQEDLEEIV